MSDEQIRELITEYGFAGESAEMALRLCRDVERNTRHEYFRLIQVANNSASPRDVTARELDMAIYKLGKER